MNKTILVVDDEKPIADILQFNLVKEGYRVICAYDGEEALQKVEEEQPDLMLLDIMLPKRDGMEVCREIRKQVEEVQEETNEIQIGALTIQPDAYIVMKRDEAIELTHREFELLHYLAKHVGQVMTREHLLQTVWGYDYFGDVRTVDVTIRRLREKIEDNPSHPMWIVTRRGVGYYLRSPEQE